MRISAARKYFFNPLDSFVFQCQPISHSPGGYFRKRRHHRMPPVKDKCTICVNAPESPSGGNNTTRGQIYALLRNPIYIGRIKHKDNVWDGRHDAIISEDLWECVQRKLQAASARPRTRIKDQSRSMPQTVLSWVDGSVYAKFFDWCWLLRGGHVFGLPGSWLRGNQWGGPVDAVHLTFIAAP